MSEYSKLSSAYVKEDFVTYQKLKNPMYPDYCLTAVSSAPASSTFTNMGMRKCFEGNTQQFLYNSATSQIQTFIGGTNPLCLGFKSDESGVNVDQYPCDSNSVLQKWKYDQPSAKILSPKGIALDINEYGTVDQVAKSGLKLRTSSTSPSQKWITSRDCKISPANNPFSPCDAKACGTNGVQTRLKYKVDFPKLGLGTDCNDKDIKEIESTPCSAPACPVPVNCVITPSGLPYGACSATQCGKNGVQTRKKYRITSPSMYGGKCDNENDTEQIVCSAPACPVPVPVDCVLTPSGLPYGACSATACGTTGKQTRLRYQVDKPSINGGKCDKQYEEDIITCSAPACTVYIKPSPFLLNQADGYFGCEYKVNKDTKFIQDAFAIKIDIDIPIYVEDKILLFNGEGQFSSSFKKFFFYNYDFSNHDPDKPKYLLVNNSILDSDDDLIKLSVTVYLFNNVKLESKYNNDIDIVDKQSRESPDRELNQSELVKKSLKYLFPRISPFSSQIKQIIEKIINETLPTTPSQVLVTPSPSPSQVLVTPTPSPSQVLVTPSPTPTPSQVLVTPTPTPSQVLFTPTPSPSTQPTFIEKNKWYVIAGVILLLILIGVGIVAMKKKSE